MDIIIAAAFARDDTRAHDDRAASQEDCSENCRLYRIADAESKIKNHPNPTPRAPAASAMMSLWMHCLAPAQNFVKHQNRPCEKYFLAGGTMRTAGGPDIRLKKPVARHRRAGEVK
jgi:hypothetical protein